MNVNGHISLIIRHIIMKKALQIVNLRLNVWHSNFIYILHLQTNNSQKVENSADDDICLDIRPVQA